MTALLSPRQIRKPWGREDLCPIFSAHDGNRIGEIEFDPLARIPDLLVKYIFTSEKLSVQVHPDADHAPGNGTCQNGKDECWLIVDAEPGATVGVGFGREVSADEMRKGALDGSIEDVLAWHQVAPGDFLYIPAGTVHAIGAGISLIEVQQRCDVTYRFYDYGRDRDLHLDEAIATAIGSPHPSGLRSRVGPDESASLVDGPHFLVDQVEGQPDAAVVRRYPGGLLVIPRFGHAIVSGEKIVAGQCAYAASIAEVEFQRDAVCLLTGPCTP